MPNAPLTDNRFLLLDSANTIEWNSSWYDQIDGGDYFTTSLFDNPNASTTSLGWDMNTIEWKVNRILVVGENGFSVYRVTAKHTTFGEFEIGEPSNGPISYIAVYGDKVPDTGTTLTLLGLAIVGLIIINKRKGY